MSSADLNVTNACATTSTGVVGDLTSSQAQLTLVNASSCDKHVTCPPPTVNGNVGSGEINSDGNNGVTASGNGKDVCLVCSQPLQKCFNPVLPNPLAASVPKEGTGSGVSPGPELSKEALQDQQLTFLDFCNLLKVNVPATLSKQALWTSFRTPLCDKCMEDVVKIRTLYKQIEGLERSLATARNLLKDRVVEHVGSGNDCCDDVDQELNAVTGIVFIVNRIRNCIRKDVSDSAFHKKRGRKPGQKVRRSVLKPEGAKPTTAAILKESSSRKSSFGRVVKRPRYFMMSEGESGDDVDDVEKKFDPSLTPAQQKQNESSVIPSDLVKVEMANIGVKRGGKEPNGQRTKGTEVVEGHAAVIAESKSEVEQKSNNDDLDFQANASDGNWSDGIGQLFEDEDRGKGKIKKKIVKKKHLKNLQKRKNKLITSSSVILNKRKKIVGGALQKVKLVGVNGEDLGNSVVGNGLEKQNVQGVEHLKVETKVETDESPKFKCGKCTREFSDVKRKNRHMEKVHDGQGVMRDYECKGCDKKFPKLKELSSHRKAEHPPTSQKLDPAGRKLFHCKVDSCKVVFKNYCDLQVHHRLHTGEKPFKCSIDNCKEAFISKGRYEVHVEVKHPGKAPLKCEFCPRSFFRHHRLRDHKKSHTGEKPYLCEICSKAFTQPAYLKYHQTQHKELNLAEFKCDECERTFASPVNLKYHKETQHQKKYRYRCETCGHGTSHMSHMKLHMLRHTGERPHTCSVCQKSFTRGSQLKIHFRSHTGERPYPCTMCTKSFTNSSKLRRHELTHADNKAKRRQSVVKVTHLSSEGDQQNHFPHSSTSLAGAALAGTSSGILVPGDVVDVEVDEDTNGHAVLKLEHVPSSLTEQDFQQQLITIQQPNGVTYQLIASEDGISTEPFTEYILINGDFTLG